MKKIKYKVLSHTLVYNPEKETVEKKECFAEVIRDYSEANEETAKREAYNGKYTVEEVDEPEAPPTDAERIAELEEALNMLLNGVTE